MIKPSALDPAVTERFGKLLRAHGLRRMASRIAVLAVLEPSRGHLSVAEIDQRLREGALVGSTSPDLATIYRTVTTLVEQGLLHALTVKDGVTRYGLAADPHHHAVCTRCGSIAEVPAQQLTSALEHAMAGSSFALSERAGLTLHGLCPQCQAEGGGPLSESERDELNRLRKENAELALERDMLTRSATAQPRQQGQ